MTFPGSGFSGPTGALAYMELYNPAASAGASVAFNLTGGTAVVNGASSITLAPLAAPLVFTGQAVPNAVSVIASASSTPYVCYYR